MNSQNDDMTTPTLSKSEEKRQRIIDTAAELFMDNGYDGISMDNIAKVAGVSKQTVYSHFGTKEDLFRHCIEGKCLSGSLSPSILPDDQAIEDVLLHMAHLFVELIMSDDGVRVQRICISGAEKYPEVSQTFFEAGPESIKGMLADYLQRQVDKGLLKIDNCEHAAWQFLFLMKSEQPFRNLLGLPTTLSPEELEAYIKSSVQLFLRGYAP